MTITLLIPSVDFLGDEYAAKFIAEPYPGILNRLLIVRPTFAMSDEFTVRAAKALDEVYK